MAFEPRLVGTARVASGRVFDVEALELEADGERFRRDVVRHRGAVAVLPVDGDEVVLVRQWRAPLARSVLEIPAGTRDVEGEDAETTARRELEEEAGVRADRLERLCEVWNAPGWSDQRTIVFLATGLTRVPRRPHGPEEAAIEVLSLPLADALGVLDGSEPCDATTAIALLALAARSP